MKCPGCYEELSIIFESWPADPECGIESGLNVLKINDIESNKCVCGYEITEKEVENDY